MVGEGSVWRSTQTEAISPPLGVVQAVFGMTEFARPMGCYLAMEVGDSSNFPEGVSATPLFYGDSGFAGAILEFRGLRFVIWLDELPLPPFPSKDEPGLPFGEDALRYRLQAVRFENRGALSQRLVFDW